MGKIIQYNNGKTTIFTTGENMNSLPLSADTYYVGVDLNSGIYEKVNPDGNIINLESSTIVPTTYSDLVELINTNSLIPGTYYSFDFLTIYDQPDFNIDLNPKNNIETKSGTNKTLIVLATNTNTISNNVHSPEYPNSKIAYDWSVNSTEFNGNPMQGRITELIDSENNRTDYDHKDIIFIRYQRYNKNVQLTGVISDFDCTTGAVVGAGTYFTSEVSIGDILIIDSKDTLDYTVGVKVLSITDDSNLVVEVDPNYSSTIFSGNAFYFFNSTSTGDYSYFHEFYIGQKINNEYIESPTFASDCYDNYINNSLNFNSPFYLANNVIGKESVKNTIGTNSINNSLGQYFRRNTIGNYFFKNVINISCENNNIYNVFYNNEIGSGFEANSIGNYFYDKIINTDFKYNSIKNFFTNNIVGSQFTNNQIGNSCKSNTFATNFGFGIDKGNGNIIGDECKNNVFGAYSYNNVINNTCKNNVFGAYFINNEIGNYCLNNFISDYCQSNQIGDYFGNNFDYGLSPMQNFIGDNFKNNVIGNYFGNDYNFPSVGTGSGGDGGNIIDDNFQFNEIGDNFIFNITSNIFDYNKISDDCWLNYFGSNTRHNTIGDLFVGNSGIGGFGVAIGTSFISNKISNYSAFNEIDSNFLYNNIGYFFGNAGPGTQNIISTDFKNNKIGDYFGDDGSHVDGGNIIGIYFGENQINDNFIRNNIGDYLNNNQINGKFSTNITSPNFMWNVIDTSISGQDFGAPLSGNILTFSYMTSGAYTDGTYTNVTGTTSLSGSSAEFTIDINGGSVTAITITNSGYGYVASTSYYTETITLDSSQYGGGYNIVIYIQTVITPSVYQPYTCQIFERQGGDKRLSYYDSSDTLTITDINL